LGGFPAPLVYRFDRLKGSPIFKQFLRFLHDRQADLRIRLRAFHTRIHYFQTLFARFVKSAGMGRYLLRTFRTSAAFSVVFSSAILVSATNFSHQREDGTIFGYFGGEQKVALASTEKRLSSRLPRTDNLSLAPLSSAPSSVETSKEDVGTILDIAGNSNLSLESQVVISNYQSGANAARDPEEGDGVKIYTVAEGDTVSGIAAAYGITVNTILWANDLENVDSIKPGDQIFILPVAGLTYVIKPGETLDDIAKKFKADKGNIIAFNNLPANGDINVGESIVIPGGSKEVPVNIGSTSALDRRQYATSGGAGAATDLSTGGWRKLEGKAGSGHRFPYGYCTWYVAQKRFVPWSGNAGTWIYNARTMGYKTGRTPTVGAIVVTTENRFYGHVAVVEKVEAGQILVSEMNYRGWAKTDRRYLSTASRVIKGYIY
jgi:surface antigen/LysM repeat protein